VKKGIEEAARRMAAMQGLSSLPKAAIQQHPSWRRGRSAPYRRIRTTELINRGSLPRLTRQDLHGNRAERLFEAIRAHSHV
jgi:hypothetical protein